MPETLPISSQEIALIRQYAETLGTLHVALGILVDIRSGIKPEDAFQRALTETTEEYIPNIQSAVGLISDHRNELKVKFEENTHE